MSNEPWIQTYSGRVFNLLNPDIDSINIEDIAHSLSMQCRFTGQCKYFYSIAQHSVQVANLVYQKTDDYKLMLTSLLHDASEAYISDISSQLKSLLPEYKKIELNIEKAIAKRFNLYFPFPPEIKEADLILLATEHEKLMNPCDKEWSIKIPPIKTLTWEVWPQQTAKELFLNSYEYFIGNL